MALTPAEKQRNYRERLKAKAPDPAEIERLEQENAVLRAELAKRDDRPDVEINPRTGGPRHKRTAFPKPGRRPVRKVPTDVLIRALAPIHKVLEDQGRRNAATLNPGAALTAAHELKQHVLAWCAGDEVTGNRKKVLLAHREAYLLLLAEISNADDRAYEIDTFYRILASNLARMKRGRLPDFDTWLAQNGGEWLLEEETLAEAADQ